MSKYRNPVLLSLLLYTGTALAQSMTVIGTNTWARDCFMASTLAAQMHMASGSDIKTCNKALQVGNLNSRDLVATLVNRGVVYAALEKYQRAIKDYNSAINLNPKSGEVYVNLGNLYLLDRKYDTAIAHYDRALELGLSRDHIAHFNRGMAWENLGETDRAELDYRRAMELSPQWAIPQRRLQRMQRRLAQLDALDRSRLPAD